MMRHQSTNLQLYIAAPVLYSSKHSYLTRNGTSKPNDLKRLCCNKKSLGIKLRAIKVALLLHTPLGGGGGGVDLIGTIAYKVG